MIVLIDNYDSFTYNLAQLAGKMRDIYICRNDDPEILSYCEKAEGIIISPGPGGPEETGKVSAVIQKFYKKIPILGICLGHQTIASVFNGKIRQADRIYHGKHSLIRQHHSRLLADISPEFSVIRYHSLVIDPKQLPKDFQVTAVSEEDQEIMAIEHIEYPVFGIQFHPESIGTKDGEQIIRNFIQFTGGENA